MHFPSLVSILVPLSLLAAVGADIVANDDYNSSGLKLNGITADVREKYMRLVNEKLYEQAGSVCPFASFGAMIVNHTAYVFPSPSIQSHPVLPISESWTFHAVLLRSRATRYWNLSEKWILCGIGADLDSVWRFGDVMCVAPRSWVF